MIRLRLRIERVTPSEARVWCVESERTTAQLNGIYDDDRWLETMIGTISAHQSSQMPAAYRYYVARPVEWGESLKRLINDVPLLAVEPLAVRYPDLQRAAEALLIHYQDQAIVLPLRLES